VRGAVGRCLVAIAVAVGFAQLASAGEPDAELRSLVSELERVLTHPTPPTLAAYQRFFGGGDELEIMLEERECARQGLDVSACARWRTARWDDPNGEPSLLLRLIREHLGTKHAMRIVRVSTHDTDPGTLPFQFVDVEFGSYRMELYRPLRDEGQFGRLKISTIDGRSLYGDLVPDI
jgi:hypothetical protein